MTKAELKNNIDEFFSDSSRTQAETKDALLELAEHMEMLAGSLESDDR